MRGVWLTLLLLPLAVNAAAPLYVSDRIEVALRSDHGGRGEVISRVVAGDPLELLIEQGEDLLVRASDGSQGWLLRRQVDHQTPLRQRLVEVEADRARLRHSLRTAQARLAELGVELDSGQQGDDLLQRLGELELRLNQSLAESAGMRHRIEVAIGVLSGRVGVPVSSPGWLEQWWQPLVALLSGLLIGMVGRRRYQDSRSGVRITLG